MIELLKTAMDKGRTIACDYDGKHKIVEVHAVGVSTADKLVARVFQVAGEASRPLPIWALLELDKMENTMLSAMPLSEAPRVGYKLNDKQMKIVYAQLPLPEGDKVAA